MRLYWELLFWVEVITPEARKRLAVSMAAWKWPPALPRRSRISDLAPALVRATRAFSKSRGVFLWKEEIRIRPTPLLRISYATLGRNTGRRWRLNAMGLP